MKPNSSYFLKVSVSAGEIIDLPYNFNDAIEDIKKVIQQVSGVPAH